MATITWYDPEAECQRTVRFTGEQPQQVTAQLERAQRFEALRAAGFTRQSATAQLDAEAGE